jgi:hypothetical protein
LGNQDHKSDIWLFVVLALISLGLLLAVAFLMKI